MSSTEVSDLAVFETRTGGRAFSVGVMRPGWYCAMFTDTAQQLHGSVEGDSTGVDMRIITYPLSKIDNLLRRAAADPLEHRRQLAQRSDARLLARLLVA
jgi:hypothetical protein